jgi:hypothetical protein
MRYHSVIFAVSVLVAMTADVTASPALLGEPMHQFPGSLCQPETDAIAPMISLSTYGVQNNSSTSFATVWCPVIHNHGSFGNYNLFSSIFVYDRHPVVPVSCTLYQLDVDGNVLWSWTLNSTGSGASTKQLVVDDNSHTNTWYGYAWKCVIPPTSGGQISHVGSYNFYLSEF